MQLITRAFGILEEIASHPEGAGLSDIAAATGLPAATSHRLLAALADAGLVEREDASKRYRPGPALVLLSAKVSSLGAGPLMESALAGLRDRWQECFFLAAQVGDSVVSVRVAKTVNPNRMTVSVPLGRRMSPHAAASCKAILAFMPPERRAEFIAAAGGLTRLTPYTITDPQALEAQLDELRATCVAECDQEAELGVGALAVPIIATDGEVRASLAVIGPRDRLWAKRDAGLAEDMLAAATHLAALQAGDTDLLVANEV